MAKLFLTLAILVIAIGLSHQAPRLIKGPFYFDPPSGPIKPIGPRRPFGPGDLSPFDPLPPVIYDPFPGPTGPFVVSKR
ncbi:hypothetical protein ElyMa_003725600 [Elysia marginata]|uniref:Uncharacterized protein n=1 Tax=Elysia marginata TaxID=1093978 RepID=A0AAV4F490_9GAST|nr:hypothetical protein ElyMa_003725600 [Elysia marginata]